VKASKLHEEVYGTTDPEGVRYAAVAVFAAGYLGHPLEVVAQLQPMVEQQRAAKSAYLARLLWFQGVAYLGAGRYLESAGCLQEAETLAVTQPDLSFQLPNMRADLGRALLGLGRLDEAAVKLEDAISGAEAPHTATPAQADAHAALARLLLKRNDPRAALPQATTAAEFWLHFDPENPAREDALQLRSQALRAVEK
jgi:tetratricopeptide (TPR) repeat protein